VPLTGAPENELKPGARPSRRVTRVEVIPIGGIPEVETGADVAELIVRGAARSGVGLMDGDVLVVKQKIVSKAEGRLVRLASVRPGARARRLAKEEGKDPKLVQLVLDESRRVVRRGHGVIITETKHGFVCANSGIDKSNVPRGFVALLPVDSDKSARKIRKEVERLTGKRMGVIVTDTFGRPWRLGQTDVAIGCSGISPLVSYSGKTDEYGYTLRVTQPAIADEIAGAAELVIGKLTRMPAAVVRGVKYRRSEAGAVAIVIGPDKDMFR
jgi:coenzyme F420-0:L-glutamate ligase / coenzyme F420-1:gamma-L-glutamate ligase